MMLAWIHSSPTWLWGTAVIIALDAAACVGLAIFHRLVHIDVRRNHNELTGFALAMVSVTYAVLLAFIAIATWESYTRAEGIVDREADCVGSIYRDTRGLPAAMGHEIRADVRRYTNIVIHTEWPMQQLGKIPMQGWEPLREIHTAIVTMHPNNAGQAVIEAELLRTLNLLYRARSSRLAEVRGHVPEVIWWIIFIGAGLTVGFTYLLGFNDFRMHLVITTGVSTLLALIVVLVIALDWPFRGKVSVSPDAFIKAEESWKDLSFERQPSHKKFPPGSAESMLVPNGTKREGSATILGAQTSSLFLGTFAGERPRAWGLTSHVQEIRSPSAGASVVSVTGALPVANQ